MQFNSQLMTLRSLFVAMAIIQLATAASGTLVPLVFSELGASQEEASLAASAYSFGFLLGCFVVSKSIADVGHIRAFAAGAAITTAAAILLTLSNSIALLVFFRFLGGMATAGLFSIGDAWISGSAQQSARGKVLAVYSVILGLVSVLSQFLVVSTPENTRDAFSFIALVYCGAILVLAITRTAPPDSRSKASIRLRGLLRDAPAAAVGVFTMGMVSTTLLSVAPYHAVQLGIAVYDVALLVGLIYLGRVLFQFPLGWFSDKIDRRVVIFFASVIATGVLFLMALLVDPSYEPEPFNYASTSFFALCVLMIALGGSLLTLYSVLVAHAVDRTAPVFVSSAAITMLLVWTLGSITGPLLANAITTQFGDTAMHWGNFAVMLAYVVFLGGRIKAAGATPHAEQTKHTGAMPTSTAMAPTRKR